MQIRSFEPSDATGVYGLLVSSGWQHRIASEDYLRSLIAASQRVVVAVEEVRIAGFARAITDGLSNGYLSMVVVDQACRGKGIGTALVEKIVGAEPGVTWVLRAGRDGAQQFFQKLGFTVSTEAMERVRRVATGPR